MRSALDRAALAVSRYAINPSILALNCAPPPILARFISHTDRFQIRTGLFEIHTDRFQTRTDLFAIRTDRFPIHTSRKTICITNFGSGRRSQRSTSNSTQLPSSVPYAVFEISATAALPEQVEQLGSKPKFWFRWDRGERRWLFKYARSATGEHWAEKIGAEVANLLGLPHAIIELCKFGDRFGTASPSFVPPGFDLIHGNEILAGRILRYDARKKFRQNDHTFPRIVQAFYDIFPEGPQRIEALTTLAGYLTLDAVVCNVDRHHENWGILRSSGQLQQAATQEIAPTFDHASSLGRELRDDKRTLLLKRGRVAQYVSKGFGAIYWKESDARGENPLALCIRAASIHRSYFRPWIDRLKMIAPTELELLVSDVPDDWMSPIAKQFAKAILSHTTNELRKL